MDISKEIGPFNSAAPSARPPLPRTTPSGYADLSRRDGKGRPPPKLEADSFGRKATRPQPVPEYQRQKLRAIMAWAKWHEGTKAQDGPNSPPLLESLAADLPLLTPLSVVFEREPDRPNPSVAFLGSALERLAEPTPAASGHEQAGSACSTLLSLIFDLSADAIASRVPHEFEAQWQDRFGFLHTISGFALPFSKDEQHVDQVMAAITIAERNQSSPGSILGTGERELDELLLDQELEPAGDPQPADPPQNVPFILVSLPDPGESGRAQRARETDRPPNLLLIAGDKTGPDADVLDLAAWSLTRCLEEARGLAAAADVSEARSHGALYAAIGSAYDLALAASQAPEELEQLLHASNIAVVPRAPMTGIVKLVFGSDYDKTRIAEYSAVLALGRRKGLESGALAKLLDENEGGLKGLVQEERRLRRSEQGKEPGLRTVPRAAIARKLRSLPARPLSELSADGDEFVLVLARRPDGGTPVLLGEIPRDPALLERAARKLVAQLD